MLLFTVPQIIGTSDIVSYHHSIHFMFDCCTTTYDTTRLQENHNHRHINTVPPPVTTQGWIPPTASRLLLKLPPTSPVLAHPPNVLARQHQLRETSSRLAERSRTALIIELELISPRLQDSALSLAVLQEWP